MKGQFGSIYFLRGSDITFTIVQLTPGLNRMTACYAGVTIAQKYVQ